MLPPIAAQPSPVVLNLRWPFSRHRLLAMAAVIELNSDRRVRTDDVVKPVPAIIGVLPPAHGRRGLFLGFQTNLMRAAAARPCQQAWAGGMR